MQSQAELGQTPYAAAQGPHEHALVPPHWTHMGSSSPFSPKEHYELTDSTTEDPEQPRSRKRRRRAPLIPPTRAEYVDPQNPQQKYRWTTRAHRKGVPPQLIRVRDDGEDLDSGWTGLVRREKSWWKAVIHVRWWGWDWRDISWWVGFLFTLGSVFWCIQGIQVFCFPNRTTTVFTNTETAMAFLGGTLFWVGAYLGYVESLNPAFADWDGAFGYELGELKRTITDEKTVDRGTAENVPQEHTLGKRRRHFGRHAPPPPPMSPPRVQTVNTEQQTPVSTSVTGSRSSESDEATLSASSPSVAASRPKTTSPERPDFTAPKPNWYQRTHHPRWKWFGLPTPGKRLELGFIANAVQLVGATSFQVSVICGLPGVLAASGSSGGPAQEGYVESTWIGAYWATQVIGSPAFIFAGWIFALETQTKWWKPNLMSIGWWIGIWNFIGGWGFEFSGIFGIWRQTDIHNPEKYQYWGTAFSTFWGSWAFLIGSYIQMLETLNKWT